MFKTLKHISTIYMFALNFYLTINKRVLSQVLIERQVMPGYEDKTVTETDLVPVLLEFKV